MLRARRQTAAILAAGMIAIAGASSAGAGGGGTPSLDAATAVRLISEYRVSHGLPPVKLEPRLTKIATVHSQRMAAADQLEHVLPGEGSFGQRIAAGGYTAASAAENIGAGQSRLTDAIAAWKASAAHNANLLNPSVTEMGIAVSSTASGKYHTYWTLVLAQPAAAVPPGAATAGFRIGPFVFGG